MSVIEVTYKPYKEKKVKSSKKNKKTAKEESSTNDNSSLSSAPNNNNVGKNTGFRYPAYLSEEEVKEGLENGSLIEGILRVNQRNTEQCFVDNPDGDGHNELLILGPQDRNRGLHGDLVAVKLKSKEFCPRFPHAKYHRISDLDNCCSIVKEKHLIKSAQVVAILEKNASRRVVGHIRPMYSSTAHFIFVPVDSRVPRILIPIKRAPTGFYDRPQDFEKFLYLAQLQEWEDDCINPRGKLLDNLGKAGDVNAEHLALLLVNGVDVREYESHTQIMKDLRDCLVKLGVEYIEVKSEEVVEKEEFEGKNKKKEKNEGKNLRAVLNGEKKAVPSAKAEEKNGKKNTIEKKLIPILNIDPKEFDYRRDFRKEVVVTIDPLTARDLDDALHIKRIKGENSEEDCWEVGVHIADVAYFLPIDTEVNSWARSRGTTVYLVHKAIPMLPSDLCEHLCSLNPGVERLTFSIVWTMDDEANILSTWFGRSVIKSCSKLSYEHAQDIIENPKKQFAINELPKIHDEIKIHQIKKTITNLNFIAKKLKRKRFGRGGLKFDLPKLRFDLEQINKDEKGNLSGTWIPRGLRLDQRKDSNFLVEELMLLANMEVAQRLYKYYDDRAMLRRHPTPKRKELKNMVEKCAKLGIKIDSTNSKTLGESIEEFTKVEQYAYTVAPALNQLLIKCMNFAQYFCTGAVDGPADFSHYGLGVDFYTHFTSPIRRYPDIIVHRLLAASLDYTEDPDYSVKQLNGIAMRANSTKACAKMCSETSADIFFGSFIREYGGMEVVGVVMALFDECFDLLLIKYGIVKQVPSWVKDLQPEERQTINCMCVVRVKLVNVKDTLRYEANLIPTPDSNPLTWVDAKQHMDE
uniref:Ribonuclease II/R domain-containing protein n=1 Tax=Meloidogyne javanica TaxID=6303 RepID=A0A915MCV9_MELJA